VHPANPYADLRALLDSTRRLDPEEVAELQLEQGYADRALAIYEALLASEPSNAGYRRRRDWLARLATVRQRPVRCVSASSPPPPAELPRDPVDATLRGVRPVAPSPPVPASEPPGATLRGLSPAPRRRRSTARGHAGPAPTARATTVRRLAIVGVR
jgi:hypothetical protein